MAFAKYKVTENFTIKMPIKDRLWYNLSFEPNLEKHISGWKTRDGKHHTVSEQYREFPVSCCPVTLSAQP
jgi:hypothetical protein